MNGTSDRPRWRVLGRILSSLLDRLDERVSAPIDAEARARGLTVTRIPGTRNHRYRDDRWSRRHLCGSCFGSGLDGARDCGGCAGVGVVTAELAIPTEELR